MRGGGVPRNQWRKGVGSSPEFTGGTRAHVAQAAEEGRSDPRNRFEAPPTVGYRTSHSGGPGGGKPNRKREGVRGEV